MRGIERGGWAGVSLNPGTPLESIEHVLWEQLRWFDMYLKDDMVSAGPEAADRASAGR